MRQRFSKSRISLDSASDATAESLREVFFIFEINDFQDEISFWLELSLINNQSVYNEGEDREDVMDFCRELVKLTKALCMFSMSTTHEKAVMPGTTSQSLLTRNEDVFDDPHKIIENFCSQFSMGYAETEMLDLLDSVITYKGSRDVDFQNLVLFYRCLHYLVLSAYSLNTRSAK